MGTGKLSGKPDEMLGGYLQWTRFPYRRSSNIILLDAQFNRNWDKLNPFIVFLK